MKQLQQWAERIDAMALRERALLLGVCLVVLLLVFDLALYRQASERIERGQQRLIALESEAAQTQAQLQVLREQARQDPNAPLHERLAQLNERRQSLEAQLGEQAGGLISPQQMRALLADLLRNTEALSLEGVRNRTPRPLVAPGENGTQDHQAILWEHRLQLTFCGPYLATLDYLRGIEELPWGLIWQSFSMHTEQNTPCYLLGVATFSFEEDAIGL